MHTTLCIMSLVWNTLTKKSHSFVCYRKRDHRGLRAKRLKSCGASSKKEEGLVTVRKGDWMAKGQRGHRALRPGHRLPLTSFQKTARGVKKSFRRGGHRAVGGKCWALPWYLYWVRWKTASNTIPPLPPIPTPQCPTVCPYPTPHPSQHAVGINLLWSNYYLLVVELRP